MGNTGSNPNKTEIDTKDLINLQEQNKLYQDIIKNQVLKGQVHNTQREMDRIRNENVFLKSSSNPLLTNPLVQQEFMKNKNMQKQLLEIIQKQKNKNLDNNQYTEVNEFLKKLQLEEKIDSPNKSHLFMNQSDRNNESTNFSISNSNRDKLQREYEREKNLQRLKLEEEQKKRKKEYENKLNQLDIDNINPYKILEINKNSTLKEIKSAYKRKARVYHPDKFGGDGTQFKIVTMAFLKIIEKIKKKQEDKQFFDLKEASRKDIEKQQNESKKNKQFMDKRINMKGNNFNNKLFNKIYEDNRLYNPNDEGYSNWCESNSFETDKIPKLFSNEFNLNVFNNTFNDDKQKNSNEIIKYQEPQSMVSASSNSYVLGQGNISDYSGCTNGNTKLEYTDLKKAHTNKMININNIRFREYRNLDELEKDRSKKMFLTNEEREVIEMNKILEKQKEDERKSRLMQNDNKSFELFERVNKIFLNN